MGTITLKNFRTTADVTMRVRLKDGGIAIDWSGLTDIKAWLYSDAQKAIEGRCDVTIDQDDSTLLVCTFAASKPQYPGVQRIIVQANYMGRTKTYDKPAFNFVSRTADQADTPITIDDPDVTVEIEVEDVSSSILDEIILAALAATERANEAAEAAEHMVDIHTGPQGPKGETGETGPRGPAGIESVTAGIGTNDPSQAPSVNATIVNSVLGLTFNNIKGAKGDKGDTGQTGATGAKGDKGDTGETGPQGPQGNTGSSVDYPFTIVNNLTTDDATQALSAAQGVVLKGAIDQVDYELEHQTAPNYTDNSKIISNGTVSENNGTIASDFIPYVENSDIVWKIGGVINGGCLCCYDENKAYINGSYWSANGVQRSITASSIQQYAPNCKYIRASFIADYADAAIEMGETIWKPSAGERAGIIPDLEELEQEVIGFLPKDSITVNNPDYTAAYIKTDGTITENSQYAIVAPITLQNNDKILLNKGESFYHGSGVAVLFKCDASGNFVETIIAGTGTSKADSYINETGEQMFVGLCSYKENRSYIVESVLEIASKDSVDELSIRDGLVAMVAADNPASSSAKVIAKPGFVRNSNNVLIVRLYPSNTADNLTLNINNTGDYPLYYNGSRANSSNCWIANEFALLAVSSEAYYLTSFNVLRKDKINELIAALGVTNDVPYNRFLKELYLTGLSENSNYYLTVIRKDASPTGKYGLYIGDDGHYSVDNAIAFATMDYVDGKTTETLIQIKEKNSSGISGYAVVDWSVITSTGYTSLSNVKLRNIIIADVNYQPRIASYIKDAEQDVVIARNAEGISVLDKKGIQAGGDVYVLANDIKTNRPYFLNDTYSAESAFADSSYLDAKLREIPEGKHFIFTTDSHIDYYGVGLSQKETEIMDFVKTRLNAGAVIFGGDCVGRAGDAQHTDPVYSYQAAKILAVYANDKFNAFGADFLWCQGNHDANANLNSANKIPSTEIYKRTTGIMARYGKAIFDDEGIALINALTPQSGETEEQFAEKKAQMVAWFKLHYYYDDFKNKIRFIVIETGDGSDGLAYLLSGSAWDGYTALVSYLTFIADALKTCPDGWDAVLVMHQMAPSGSFTDGVASFSVRPNYALYELLGAFKNKGQVTVLGDGSVTSTKPYLYSLMQSRIGSGKVYNFSSRTSGRCFVISGHFHHDDCWIVQNENTSSIWNYRGREYGQWDTLLPNAILHIQLDRACLYEKGAANAGWPNAVSYPNQGTEEGQEVRAGKKNEVLFDVVTITTDNKIICTRIGAGNDREYTLP